MHSKLPNTKYMRKVEEHTTQKYLDYNKKKHKDPNLTWCWYKNKIPGNKHELLKTEHTGRRLKNTSAELW